MKWEGREKSKNVEDRRRMSPAGMALGGGSIIIVILALIFGLDPRKVLNLLGNAGVVGGNQEQVDPNKQLSPEDIRQGEFTETILRDTEVVWNELFRRMGKQYREPKLVLFSGMVASACGRADSSVGPFYCPGDQIVYIDTAFYQDMVKSLQAPGEFARAYVIAHEVGHHVQHLLGFSQRVDDVRRRGNEVETNRASVRLELQADFLAGVWAHHAQKKFNFLEQGDVETALNAAHQIGDDRLQKKSRGTVVPDSFTHGTSDQRKRWFFEGLKTGDLSKATLLFELPYDQL